MVETLLNTKYEGWSGVEDRDREKFFGVRTVEITTLVRFWVALAQLGSLPIRQGNPFRCTLYCLQSIRPFGAPWWLKEKKRKLRIVF
jgi:hypothetical protein